MVNGEWRVTDGQINGLDLPDLISRHKAAASALIAG
jgi:8-oxoguanine deaminase